jgi:hypothetical protein
MATTADTVQVRLQADTASYIRNLNSADAAFNKVAAGIEQDAARVNVATNKMGLNTANIAAQFQDIGVTAAMGMNPLQIALQQGTQLSAVLNQSVGQGISPVKALGSAFVQILNPISLATIAVIALGAAALQSLGEIVPKAESASEAIKRHREALEGIVRGYSAAEDAVSAYFDQVERLPQFAVSEQLRKQFDDLATSAGSLPEKLRQVVAQIEYMGDGATSADKEVARLIREFQDGDSTLEDLYASLGRAGEGLNLLERAAGAVGIGAAKTTEELRQLILQVTQFGDEYARFMALTQLELGTAPIREDLSNALNLKGYIAEQERINGLTTEQLQLEKEIARIKSDAAEFGITDERAAALAQQTLDAEKRRADIAKQLRESGKGGDKAAREYERERQAVEDLMESMGFQAALLGQSNREKAIAIALSKANATATEEERQQIASMAGFIYDTEQAIKDLNSSSQEWADTIQSATRGFIDDLIAGKDAAEAFSNVLSNIASKLIDVGLNSLFGGGGFNLAGLFGGTSTRAMGGSVYAGNPTLVGERGPEVFIPSTPGKIVPNSQVGGGGSVVFAPNIDARGADVAAVARLEQSMQRLAAEIVPTIRQEIKNGPKKGRR